MRKKGNGANRNIRYFHKWSNKGYSILNSLKVAVKICVIPLTYSLVASPSVAVAQIDTSSISKHLDLNEVIIQEDVKAEAYSELTRVVSVVTQKEIQQVAASSLQDVLEKLVNVDIRQRGSHGVQADINFRGGSFDQVLVLLNGVNITDPQTGHHNLNVPIDLNSIQRIEILQGPGARVHGPGAFSGAINIITKPDSENSIKLSSQVGEYGLAKGNLQSIFKIKKTTTLLSISHNRSDGYVENTDFKASNVFMHSVLNSNLGDFNLFAGYQDKGFGAQSFYTPKYPNQYEKTRTFISSIGYEKKWNQHKFMTNAYLRRHWDRFELFRSNPDSWYKGHNYHLSTITGTKNTYQYSTQFTRLQLGFEGRIEDIISNNLGDSLETPIRIKGEGDKYYTLGSNRAIYSVFADQVFYLKKFTVSGGFNYSYCRQFDGNSSYGVDATYQLLNGLKVYSAINRSFRNPTFTDLYYKGPSNIGNPTLKPETAITYEGGVKLNYKTISGSVGYFNRQGKNIIDWIMLPAETKWTTRNYTTLNTDGIEISLISKLDDYQPIVNSIFINYTRYWVDKKEGDFNSYYALDFMRHNLRFGINNQIISKLVLNTQFNWQE